MLVGCFWNTWTSLTCARERACVHTHTHTNKQTNKHIHTYTNTCTEIHVHSIECCQLNKLQFWIPFCMVTFQCFNIFILCAYFSLSCKCCLFILFKDLIPLCISFYKCSMYESHWQTVLTLVTQWIMNNKCEHPAISFPNCWQEVNYNIKYNCIFNKL
jgi:hypothetical protein